MRDEKLWPENIRILVNWFVVDIQSIPDIPNYFNFNMNGK